MADMSLVAMTTSPTIKLHNAAMRQQQFSLLCISFAIYSLHSQVSSLSEVVHSIVHLKYPQFYHSKLGQCPQANMRTRHVQPALTPPGAIECSDLRPIEFFHPAYPKSTPPLLALIAVDKTDDGIPGLDYETAKIACGIVAGNRWDDATYFATKVDNRGEWVKVTPPSDGVLPAGPAYYFVIENPQHQYPVTPSFDHWRFPHDRLPELWSSLNIPGATGRVSGSETNGRSAARHQDRSCRITGSTENTEVAHLVPFACSEWFKDNRMNKYSHMISMFNAIDDERNLLLLRSDIHGLFDRNRFVLIPKRIDENTSATSPPAHSIILMTHALLPRGSCEISHYYHNRTLQSPVSGITREYLFARFAMSIFCDELYGFFGSPSKYKVRLYNRETGEDATEELYGDGVTNRAQIFPSVGGRVRSISPKKRKTAATSGQESATVAGSCSSPALWDESASWDESTSWNESDREDDESEDRGRKRMRSVDYYNREAAHRKGCQQGNASLPKRVRLE